MQCFSDWHYNQVSTRTFSSQSRTSLFSSFISVRIRQNNFSATLLKSIFNILLIVNHCLLSYCPKCIFNIFRILNYQLTGRMSYFFDSVQTPELIVENLRVELKHSPGNSFKPVFLPSRNIRNNNNSFPHTNLEPCSVSPVFRLVDQFYFQWLQTKLLWRKQWIIDTHRKWISIVWHSNNKKLIAPIFKRIECTFVCCIINENYTISTTIKCWTQPTETFLSSGIPNLQCNGFVVDLYLFYHEISTNGWLK